MFYIMFILIPGFLAIFNHDLDGIKYAIMFCAFSYLFVQARNLMR